MRISFSHSSLLMAALFLLPAMISCDRDVFDEDKYIEVVKTLSPVDSIESTHMFRTTENYLVNINANVNTGTERVLILTGNPTAGETSYILASTYLSDGERMSIRFSAPVILTQFYAALVNSEEEYTVARFDAGQGSVDFTSPVSVRGRVRKTPSPQVYTYCFEDEEPEPGDYDYNDLVLRVSQERISETELKMNVTLAAIGSDMQLGAAIRLSGFSYEDIDTVYTKGIEDGETFDDGYDMPGDKPLPQEGLLMKAKNNDAVLRLFDDAHWAIGDPSLSIDYGQLTRMYYNVVRLTTEESQLISPRTISYYIKFKSAVTLNTFSMDMLDPFIIIKYNSATWEIHLCDYQGAQVFYEYNIVNSVKLLPWAIVIPNGTFRYPLQGYNIGYRKNGQLFGAYMTAGHSFGEWVEDHTKATDWYEYPTMNMVF